MTDEIAKTANATPTEEPDFEGGEKVAPVWEFRFINLSEIPAGSEHIAAVYGSSTGQEISELLAIKHDLQFAHDCFVEAEKLGMPDATNVPSRALVNAGVVSYGRVFRGGVRQARVNVEEIANRTSGFDIALHVYLLDLRDKHVAHSVNEFERVSAGPVMVRPPGGAWEPRGVGSITQYSVGLSGRQLKAAITQIGCLIEDVTARTRRLEDAEFARFSQEFEKTSQFAPVPLFAATDRSRAHNRRTR